jgi:hypothetical protein
MRDMEALDAMNRDGERYTTDGDHSAMVTPESLADWLPKADRCHVMIKMIIAITSCRSRSSSLLLHDEPQDDVNPAIETVPPVWNLPPATRHLDSGQVDKPS